MWIYLNCVLTMCQILVQVLAISSPRTIQLLPGSPDDLYLGCYEQQNYDSSFHQPSPSRMSPYKCIQACAHEAFPLAAVFNDTECHCVDDGITPLVKNYSCDSANETKIFQVYNTSCFQVEFVEIYQELTFAMCPSKITPSLSSSVSPVTLVTPSSVTSLNLSKPTMYSVDFGDGRGNTTFQGHLGLTHRYVTTGEFNVTFKVSVDNTTMFVFSRTIRVLSPLHITGMTCPAITPSSPAVCTLLELRGSDVTVSVIMNSTHQNISLSVPAIHMTHLISGRLCESSPSIPAICSLTPNQWMEVLWHIGQTIRGWDCQQFKDAPRVMLGKEGLPLTNQSDTEPGIYLLPSLEFSTDTSVEAWELYAEHPGRIQLQVYRAYWNNTDCRKTRHSLITCGDWVPPSGLCDQVCISVQYNQKPSPVSSCAHKLTNYSKVYSVDVNLTVGYNLIVIPEEERFTSRAGDIVGFQRNISGAVLQRIAAEQTPGGHYTPARNMSKSSVHLESMVALNVFFRMKVHGSIKVKAKLTVSCLQAVSLNPLTASFANAIPSYNNAKSLVLQSVIAVQNAITRVNATSLVYMAVNRAKNITATVLHGTNVTCEWSIPNSSLIERQSSYLKENKTKEGGDCQIEFSYRYVGYVPVTLTTFNLVSNRRVTIHVLVRDIIRGLKVEMCYSSFAYDNALTCYNSGVTSGTDVGCTWYFKPKEYIIKLIGQRISHALTPVGVRNFTLYCYNKVPEDNSVVFVVFPVKVITNPLSIDAPLKVPAETPVRITCQVNWSGGTPASFFAQQGVTGEKGTNIVAAPSLTLRVYSISNTSAGTVTLYKSFGRDLYRKHKVYCKADNYPDLNTILMIKAIYPITGVNITSKCPSRIEVGTSCTLEVLIIRGDFPSFRWTITEGDATVSMYLRRKIDHQFASIGVTNVSVNVSNDVSLSINKIQFIVYSPLTRSLHLSTSSDNYFLPSSFTHSLAATASPSSFSQPTSFNSQTDLASYASYTRHTSYTNQTSHTSHTSYTSSTKYPSLASTTSITPIIPSLKDAELRHAPNGLVGHAIAFSVSRVEKPRLFSFLWNWNDQTPLEEAGSALTHSFSAPGQYAISVNISSGINHVMLSSLVTVQHSITGFQIRDMAVSSSNFLTVEFEITRGNNVTYFVDYGDNSGVKKGFLSKLPTFLAVTHQYNEPSLYTLSIFANSVVGPPVSVEQSVNIMGTTCVINELGILGTGGDSSHCPEIQQEYEYSLYSSLEINCYGAEELKYRWKVELVLKGFKTETVPFQDEILSSDVLYLTAKSLKGGLYKFTLSITAIPLGISKVATGFLRVRMPNLLATIDCGSERVNPWDKEVVLDGSASRDPNDINISSALSFEWFCNEGGDVSCFKGKVNNKQPVLTFPPKFLELNTTYQFVLSVTKGARQATASQTIKLMAETFPPLCVRCKENCAHKLATSKEFVLTGEGCDNNKDKTNCQWEVYGPPSHGISRRSVDSQLISVSYSNQFRLDPSNLIPNQTYTIFFNSAVSGFTTKYSIVTDMPPSGGSCVVLPSEGVVIETQFRISCTGWSDEDSPLWYEFFFKHPSYGPMLLFYGWTPYSDGLFLPPGLEENSHKLELFVKITDVLGSYKTFPLQVKVESFSPDSGSVSSILKRVVSGPDSMLKRLLAAGEFRQATQLMTTVITVLNQDPFQVTRPDSPDTENRVEVRSRVIQGLSQMCCSSPQGISQALGGLLQAIRVNSELSPDALVDGANALTNMAKTLVTKFKSVRADQTTSDILYGLNYVVEASVTTSTEIKRKERSGEIMDWIDDSNEARNKDHQAKCERATNKSLEGVNYAAQKLLDYQRKGDPPSHVTSSLMTLKVTRQSPSDIEDAALDGGEVTFQLPPQVKKDKLNHLDAVNTKVVTMSQTPFISKDAIPMDTPVSALELLDTSGKEIEVRELTEPVSIFLSVNQSENRDLNNMTGVIFSNENMTFYKIEAAEDNSLHFTISCSGTMKTGEKMIVIGNKNARPSNKNFDLIWSLSSCNTTLQKLLSRRYLNDSDVFYIGVKLLDANNITNSTTERHKIRFSVLVKAVGCYYWNENMQAWRTDGCEVGSLTTLDRIQCQCNHLTWFGSRVFVPPNTLHMDVIAVKIKDPSNYVPVLAVLCTTCALYFCVLVWARREDKKDIHKTGLTASPSNRPGDTHFYEVVISTGMRRHAGTTANVAMTMTGERGESHAFLLKYKDCTRLARSSLNSFLVTTSETLGELSYIRVWHDNFGEDPAWYVKQISIREIATDGVWHFVCEHWLAVDEGDGLIDRIFPVTSKKEMKEFRRLFLTKTYKDLTDSHLWFSVVWRPPQSSFTRVQRVSCCFSLLLCTMMANAMFYEADKGRYTAVELGTFEFSWEQVSIGICSSLIVFPINLILVQIFRHCRSRLPRKPNCKPRERISSTQTEINMVKFGSGEGSMLSINSPAILHQRLNKQSPQEPLTSSTRDKKFSLSSAIRSANLPSVFVSLGAATSSNSTNDIRSLIQNDSRACSPAGVAKKTSTSREEENSNVKRLPWWFVYVGWALVILTSFTAASVTLLYGIEFGVKKSTQWLLSMFFSVTQDIFVSQPLKVVGLAIFFAHILKKPNTVMFSTSSRDRSDEQWLQDQLQGTDEYLEECAVARPVKVPSEDILQSAREKAAKERAMHVILLDFGTFFLFLMLVLLIAYGFRDRDAFHQNDAVSKVLLSQGFSEKSHGSKPDMFSQIVRQRDIWDWTERALLPSLYNLPSYYYTGKAPKFMEGESGLVVGVARLRQHRVKKDSCSVVPQVEGFFSPCIDKYHVTSEEDQAYTAGWKSLINKTELPKLASSPGPWRYSSASDLNGYSYAGEMQTYSGGGYVLELSHIYYKAVRQVKNARSKLWVDRYTRSVLAEFTLYNPNSNLFCVVTFLMETPPTGGVFPHAEFLAYRLYRYVGDFQVFILACEFFFFAFVLYFTYREAKKIYKNRRSYLADVWNLMDLAVLVLCWIAIAYYFICLGLRKWTLNLYHKNPTKFISFQHLSAWQLMFEGVVGVTVFVTCLKFIKLFRFNRRIFLLSYTLRRASGELLQYLLVFLVNFLAFAQIYHLLLASDYDSFSTLFGSMQKLLSVLLGKFNIEEMMSAYKVLGAVIFLLYMLITNFLFLNVLIVIIIDSFKVVKQHNDELQNEFELLEYIMRRVRDVLGIRTLNKTDCHPLAHSNNGFTPALDSHSSRMAYAEHEMAEKLDQALDKLVDYIDAIQDLETEDDLLCCYVSRRIHQRVPAIKVETVDYLL